MSASPPRGPYVCVRAVLLADGRTVGEAFFYGSEADCETVALDEPPMTGIDPATIVRAEWKVTSVRHWEEMQNGRA